MPISEVMKIMKALREAGRDTIISSGCGMSLGEEEIKHRKYIIPGDDAHKASAKIYFLLLDLAENLGVEVSRVRLSVEVGFKTTIA
ncbi:MAG: hypothetical protein J7L62_00960 [Candidatus Aminicenantes bacterium]|nr:hypothetical protein [Candidatus Aminicenantes bacterium]